MKRTWMCAFCGYLEYVVASDWTRALRRRRDHEIECNMRPDALAASPSPALPVLRWEAIEQLIEKWRAEAKAINTGDTSMYGTGRTMHKKMLIRLANELEAMLPPPPLSEGSR